MLDVNCPGSPSPGLKLLNEEVEDPKTNVMRGKAAPATALPKSEMVYRHLSMESV